MSDNMLSQPFDVLLKWILTEYDHNQSILGIHRSLFYKPPTENLYAIPDLFGNYLAAPIGPAAGPHTQLAQNIICAWLSGGRFIELKTVQIMDELEIPRPCIDMEDEGYNVEWSQELKLEESAREYINAWALIHILRRLLKQEDTPFGTVFNMSVGYNLEGIQSAPMTRFMSRMNDASEEIEAIRNTLRTQFPQFADIEIPTRLTNNVTLSTMHGCPPNEIERIACYLMEERGLHTTVKLNPTLLGKETVLHILHDDLGFHEINIPNAVFEHDLEYKRAIELVQSLRQVASRCNLSFGVKLSNTLPMENHKNHLPGKEMYMSGRALYPITINLFNKLMHEFKGDLKVSYSAGADALNVNTILACGARPITVASDLLKPGGYSRLLQYLENLENELHSRGASSLDELAKDRMSTLEQAASAALKDPRYKKEYFPYGSPKSKTNLGLFDCIMAPCMEQCAVCQDVPEYNWLIAQGQYDRALEVILSRNPLPGVTGHVCTHLCQTRCVRNDYEEPVAIRTLKRFAAEKGRIAPPRKLQSTEKPHKAAVIGSGPSGLSAAYFLALNGVQVTIFEARDVVGGMMRLVPVFRVPSEIIQQDVSRITALGVEIKLSHPITKPPEELLKEGFDAVYVASGFQKNMPLTIPGIEAKGVYSALDLLERARRGKHFDLGRKALVIGGGDTAMDAARLARRITGQPATIVYRRTRQEIPASQEELEGAFEEGTLLEELATPVRVITENDQVVALECLRNRLGEPDSDGRRRPVPIEGSNFQIQADSIVIAIGQLPDLTFLEGSRVQLQKNGSISTESQTGLAGTPHVYAGGDVVDGPESIIAACADGRRAAESICRELNLALMQPPSHPARLSEEDILQVKRARTCKEIQNKPAMLPAAQRSSFDLVEMTLTEDAARKEAGRCFQCTTFCDKCVEVCPNRSNMTYTVSPLDLTLPRLSCQGDRLSPSGQERFQITQTRQIIHVDDFCNQCGNCETFCVHTGKPYLEKPRLFLSELSFLEETDNAFFIQKEGNGWIIRRREDGKEMRLSMAGGTMIFENEFLKVTFQPDFHIKDMGMKAHFEGEFSLAGAAEMALLLKGITGSMTFLPLG